MISVKTESKLPSGLVRRRYEVTITDLLGNESTEIIGMFNHSPENDGSQVEADYIASKKEQEKGFYIDEIRSGVNPFKTHIMRWHVRTEFLKCVLDLAMSLPSTDTLVINGLAFLEFVTDDELATMYEKPLSWVANVRAEALNLINSKAGFDSYNPILGGN